MARTADNAVCRSKAQGGRRCNTHLKTLTTEHIRPLPTPNAPGVSWSSCPGEQPAQLYADHRAALVNAALNTLLGAREYEPAMTTGIQHVVAGLAPGTRLTGLAERLKAPSSLIAKINAKAQLHNLDYMQAAASIDDLIRYTITTIDAGDLVTTVHTVIDRVADDGMTVCSAEHSFLTGNPYKAIHLVLADRFGHRCEVQFHTENTLATKQHTHRDYQIYRDLDAPDHTRMQAFRRCVTRWEAIPQPADLTQLNALGGVSVVVKDYRPHTPPPPKPLQDRI